MTGISEQLTVEPADAGQRLDKWLTSILQDLEYDVSRSQVQEWLDAGYIKGTSARTRSSEQVVAGQVYEVSVPSPKPVQIVGEDLPLVLVYEDEDVVVVDKPRGLVIHPAAGHEHGTVVNGLSGRGIHLTHLGGEMRPGVVHRIDKDTSGLVMFAKTDLAYHSLTEQLREHTVERIYLAIVHGQLTHDQGTIDAPIGRDPRNRQRMAVDKAGKSAVTHFRTLERFSQYSYLELQLETGRTHQIRVHMAYIGHPLAGDPVYGRRHSLPIDGQALHAATLGFVHPRSHQRLSFSSELPDDMSRLVDGLEAGLW